MILQYLANFCILCTLNIGAENRDVITTKTETKTVYNTLKRTIIKTEVIIAKTE